MSTSQSSAGQMSVHCREFIYKFLAISSTTMPLSFYRFNPSQKAQWLTSFAWKIVSGINNDGYSCGCTLICSPKVRQKIKNLNLSVLNCPKNCHFIKDCICLCINFVIWTLVCSKQYSSDMFQSSAFYVA